MASKLDIYYSLLVKNMGFDTLQKLYSAFN